MRRFEAAYARAAQSPLAAHGLPAFPSAGGAVGSGLVAIAAVAAGAVRALVALEKVAAAEGNGMKDSGAAQLVLHA